MSYTIAMAGKGGTGKTTLAALIVRLLKEKASGSILAVDADPNSNLGEALGLEPKETIGSILDEIATHPEKVPSGMPKDRFIEYQVQSAVCEGEGFDVLTMGRPEGPGCYCYVNNALRNVVAKLINDYDYVVIDNEAGLEHLSRRTTREASALVVVSDTSAVGLKAARRINDLAKELKIKTGKNLLLINRSPGAPDAGFLNDSGLRYLTNIPFDSAVEKISVSGSSLMGLDADSQALAALRKIGDKIWQ